MPNVRNKLNVRLLAALTLTATLLAFLIALIVNTGKPYSVRVIDNVFIGASFMLIFSVLFRFRSGAMAKQVKDLRVKRKTRRLQPEEAEQIKRYDVWRLFSVHFGWSSLVLFLISAVGTIVFTLWMRS